jgi:hypothetical protein
VITLRATILRAAREAILPVASSDNCLGPTTMQARIFDSARLSAAT